MDKFVLPDNQDVIKKLPTSTKPFTLLYGWASWCVTCRRHNQERVKLDQLVDAGNLQLIRRLLHTDKQAWLNAIKTAGLSREQLSAFQRWDNPIEGCRIKGSPHPSMESLV
ncbi:hypothetical protein [Spirosoma migulaei]